MRPLLVVAILTLVLPKTAAAGEVGACIASADAGQLARDRGELRKARNELVACAGEGCPTVVRADCARWLTSVEERMPSIAIRATGPSGDDVTDVRVLVDGESFAEQLDGRAIDVDPGSRTLRFERAGSEPVEMRVLLREGEKRRPIDVVLRNAGEERATTDPSGASDARRGGSAIPTASWVLGGLGVIGVGAFTGLALDLQSDVDRLHQCAPACDPRDVDAARTQTWVTNGALVAGVLALAAAGVLALTHDSSSPVSRSAAAKPPPRFAERAWFEP